MQACGDAHFLNFGGYGSPERRLVFDINDFDETLPAPWEWDVKRLAASVVLAGRQIGARDRICGDAALATVASYRTHMREYARMTRAQDLVFAPGRGNFHQGSENCLRTRNIGGKWRSPRNCKLRSTFFRR